uniref:GIY-YIG nuclease family protein n=1 Tax=Streptomyces sp. NBC_00049 TaxID=2903617 RepID=A0AAU2K3A2_9ACTN
MTDSSTALYRLRDAAGNLLYVGISDAPPRRWREHRKEMLWWREVESSEVEWHPTESSAREAEGAAIWSESPRYNHATHAGPGSFLPPGVPPQPPGTYVAYRDAACRPAYRRAWCMWRLQLQDGLEGERETLRWIILLMLRARLAQVRDQGLSASRMVGPPPRHMIGGQSSPSSQPARRRNSTTSVINSLRESTPPRGEALPHERAGSWKVVGPSHSDPA